MTDLAALADVATVWPFQEARALRDQRLGGKPAAKDAVLFETGYGPSGLPHIGTFGEVVRTTMVRRAFEALCPGVATRLIAFSDDMDGLRKVPGNVPNQEMLAQHLGKPLTDVPDPFGTHDSFGRHNNARLRTFLDGFGFEYTFKSATDCYRSGAFDSALLAVLRNYDRVMEIILPTLGAERQATYSPFLPLCPRTGVVLQVPIIHRDPDAGTVTYRDEDTGQAVEVPVTGGHCKLQWKADWAMRWYAQDVDYEMSGKDLIDSVKLSSRICAALGGTPPQTLTYELFLDRNGEKISKSRGNGISVDQWLRYAPAESLALFMYQKPKTAKRLYFDVIPRTVDEYLQHLAAFPGQDDSARLANPVWHIHHGDPPAADSPVSYSMLLNLVSVCGDADKAAIWQYLSRYAPEATPEVTPTVDRLVDHAIAYYADEVKPSKVYRPATPEEAAALADLRAVLDGMRTETDGETLQAAVYEVGKRHACFAELRAWFTALYQILLGQDAGPRFGSFIALYGVAETITLLDRAIAGDNLAA